MGINIKWIFVTFLLLLSSSVCLSQNWDIELLKHINVHRNRLFDNFFIVVTNYAAPVAYSIPVFIFLYSVVKKNSQLKIKSVYIIASSLLALLITTGIKHLVNRARPFITYPFIQRLTSAGSPSFPSGHTSDAFTFAISMSLAFPKWYVIYPAFAWAVAVGYSRMHLGVHYPSDILASIIVAAVSSLICFVKLRRNEKNELISKM